jgi:pyridine nucleotide-disulfide oxidoreductase family protein
VKEVLLLGGGHAHVHVLQALARQPLAGTRVTLVTPFERQMYSGMVPGLVAGHYSAQDCVIPLRPLAAAAGVRMVVGSAVRLDAAARQVQLDDGSLLGCDWMSLDTGAVMHRSLLPGAREHALFVRPIEDFVQQLSVVWLRAEQRRLHIVLVGAGAAGVELALAVQHRLGPSAAGVRVSLVTGGTAPLEGYSPAVMARVQHTLTGHGVAVVRQGVVAVEATAVVLADGTRLPCDATVLATGAMAPAWLAGSGLALDARSFISTGATLQSTSHPQVFAVGDVATRSDTPHAKSGVYAVRAGPALAVNLQRALSGQALLPHHAPTRTLNLVSCGERSAIAAWGGWSAQGRWVWWLKDRIDRRFVARYTGHQGASGLGPATS